MRIDLLSVPLGISAVSEEMAESFVTVQPGFELCLPYLKLLFVKSSHWKFLRRVYLCDRHREAVSLCVVGIKSLFTFLIVLVTVHYSLHYSIVLDSVLYCIYTCTVLFEYFIVCVSITFSGLV